MASEIEYINIKNYIDGLSTTENPATTDKGIVSNPTNGPRAVPASPDALTTTATEADLVASSSVEIKTASGFKKLPANLVAPRSIQDNIIASLAPAFSTAKVNGLDGFAYHNDDIVSYNGKTYIFVMNKPQGAWDNNYVEEICFADIVRCHYNLVNDKAPNNIIDTSVGVGNVVDIEGEASATFSCGIVDCKAGDVFTISGQGGIHARLWAFLDTDNKVVSSAGSSDVTSTPIVRCAPVDGKFIWNSLNEYEHTDIRRVLTIDGAFDAAFREAKENSLFRDNIGSKVNVGVSYNTSVGVGNVVNVYLTTANTAFASYKVGCKKGDIFYVKGRGGSGARLWAFLDTDNKVVSVAESNLNLTEPVEMIAGQDGTFIFNVIKEYAYSCVIERKVQAVIEELIKTDDSISNENVVKENFEDFNEHIVYNTSASVGDVVSLTPSYNSGFCSIVKECSAGEVFTIKGRGGSGLRLWAFLDTDNKVVSVAESNLLISSDTDLVAPDNGKLVCNFVVSDSYPLMLKKKVSIQYNFDRIENKVNNVGESINAVVAPFAEIGVALDAVDVSSKVSLFSFGPTDDIMAQTYSAFDALVTNYSDLVSRVDAAEELGLEYPAYASGYKTYMYKFVNTNTYADNNGVNKKKKVLLTGGVHGGEIAAIVNLYIFFARLCDSANQDENIFRLLSSYDIYVVPCVNGWGILNRSRTNYNGVNINRNFPVKGWRESGAGTLNYTGPSAESEFETKIICGLCRRLEPDVFIDHHNYWEYKWQFYSRVGEKNLIPTLYGLLADCSYVFKKEYPEHFGTNYALLLDQTGSGTFEPYADNETFGPNWAYEQGIVAATVEISAQINYNGGVPAESSQIGTYGNEVFSIGEFTLRAHVMKLCDYAIKIRL